MSNFGKFGFVFLLFIIGLVACEKTGSFDPQQDDQLDQICLIGQWKLQSRIIDGIVGGAVDCCDYMEFKKEGHSNDYIGKFKVYGLNYAATGAFELNERLNLIRFDYEDESKTSGFQITADWITINYTENNQAISERWRKED